MIEGLKHDAAAPVMGADGVMQMAQPGQVINSTGSRKAASGKSKTPLIIVAALLLVAAAAGAFFVATGGGGGGESNSGAEGTVATGDDNSQNNGSNNNDGDNVALVDPTQQPPDTGPSEAQVAAERSAGTIANGTWRHANMMTMAIAAPQAVAGTIRLVLISDPIGAEVFRNTAAEGEEPVWNRLGVTPLNAEVDAGAMEVLKLTKSGFQEHYLPIDMSTTAIPPTVELTALARTASERTTRNRDSERSSSRESSRNQEEAAPQGGIGVIDEVGQTDEERAREERRRERRRERERREREERERQNRESEEGLEIL